MNLIDNSLCIDTVIHNHMDSNKTLYSYSIQNINSRKDMLTYSTRDQRKRRYFLLNRDRIKLSLSNLIFYNFRNLLKCNEFKLYYDDDTSAYTPQLIRINFTMFKVMNIAKNRNFRLIKFVKRYNSSSF